MDKAKAWPSLTILALCKLYKFSQMSILCHITSDIKQLSILYALVLATMGLGFNLWLYFGIVVDSNGFGLSAVLTVT